MEVQQLSKSGAGAFSPVVTGSGSQVAGEVAKSAASPVVSVPAHAVQQAAAVPRPEEVKQAVDKINKTVQAMAHNLQFSVDENTKINVVKVVDIETKDVIRQIPSEEVLAIAEALDKLQGLLVKEKA